MSDEELVINCGTCLFWNRKGQRGECHRRPPKHVPKNGPDIDPPRGVWPTTASTDWCGEHSSGSVPRAVPVASVPDRVS